MYIFVYFNLYDHWRRVLSQGNFGQFIRAVNMVIYVTKAIEVKIYDTFDSSWTIRTVVRVVQFFGKHSKTFCFITEIP